MNDQPGAPDPAALASTVAGIAERSQRLLLDYMNKQNGAPGNLDPLNVQQPFLDLMSRMMADPAKMMQAQISLWQDYMNLWQSAARRMMGETPPPVAEAARSDRRFKDAEWQDNPFFDYLKQSYLLTSRWLLDTVNQVEGLDDKTAKKIDFYTRQFVDAISPSNFAATNPEVLRATLESRGENLVKGLDNLLADLERGKGRLQIKMTDLDAFEVGKNVAVTPGKVVYRNDLIELIQYAPRTAEVHRRPLLVIPPWINKYYILDLRPDNSFVRWAADQGHTVFVVSWVNPDEKLAAKSFENYMLEGVLAALDAMEKATGEREHNVVGYCLGGTLLASALAYMAAKRDDRVKSATYFAALTDFAEPGDLGVFIDEEQLRHLEAGMNERGYLEGAHMATTFNMLRANDLIWSFVVNNYLLGKEPFPFDLLYWNSDSTRMPAAMHSFYLRKMYQENKLIEPGGITLNGVPIDLRKVKTPSFMLSTKDDHIAPWEATYAATQIFAGPVRFTLAASGHIAGVVSPPNPKNRYGHWTNTANPPTPSAWLANAVEQPGSWWPSWAAWIAPFGDGMVPAREPGTGKLKALADAPGTYVMVKAQT